MRVLLPAVSRRSLLSTDDEKPTDEPHGGDEDSSDEDCPKRTEERRGSDGGDDDSQDEDCQKRKIGANLVSVMVYTVYLASPQPLAEQWEAQSGLSSCHWCAEAPGAPVHRPEIRPHNVL